MNARGFAGVVLVNAKTPQNIGAALRAAYAFGASFCGYVGDRYSRIKQFVTDTPKASRHMPLFHYDSWEDARLPQNAEYVAVDIIEGATPLHRFKHPEQAVYIFGPEDGTLSEEIVNRCKHVVYIPTTVCLNLAAAVNVVLYDRSMKLSR